MNTALFHAFCLLVCHTSALALGQERKEYQGTFSTPLGTYGVVFLASGGPVERMITLPLEPFVQHEVQTGISIFDVNGRLVSVVRPGTITSHGITWDGKDLRRQPVPPGIYFYTLDHNTDELFAPVDTSRTFLDRNSPLTLLQIGIFQPAT